MVFPIIQKIGNIVEIDKLNGAIIQLEKPVFSFKNWFSGEYQEKKEKYVNENFGFRNLFVRLNNQIYFDFFNKAKANGVIIGKQNYLYEENYIKAFYGTDFIGKDSIRERMEKFKYVQDTLQKLNKNLLLIFAAGKGTFYSEYIPNKYKVKKRNTNYDYHLKIAKKLGISYIDFNQYFLKNKYKSKYPLYPKYGIHWSIYGMCLAADSIIKHIEKDRKIDMNSIYWEKVELEVPKNEDYDIAGGMNLLFNLKSFKMGYPQIKFEKDTSKIKPNLLVVSDSYYWGMFNFGISSVFNESHFWYYNKEIYPDTYSKPLTTDQIDLRKEINKHDVIIVMSTQATMTDLGWGFIEKAYELYHK
jgi:hypothetical protein